MKRTVIHSMEMRSTTAPLALALALAFLLSACSKPPKTTADVDTMREASFVSQKEDPNAPKGPTVVRDEDDAPVPAASRAAPSPAPSASASAQSAALPEPEITTQKLEKPAKKPSGAEKITRAECAKMFDRYFDLVLESDARFADLGTDGKAMIRQMASQDKAFASLQKDCESDVPRPRYTCAMSAKSPAAWQACLK